MTADLARLLPCPFCGHTGVTVHEGSTFRWRYAACDECGAQSCEIRIQTLGDGAKEEWEQQARIDAIAEWNRRSPALLTELEQLRNAVINAETVINRGVELMTTDQVGNWTGVRHWLETQTIDAAQEAKCPE